MIKLRRAVPQHRSLLRQLYELYCYDFSPMTRDDIGSDGFWTADDFLIPWPDDLHIYLIAVDDHWAGFAWVAFGSYIDPHTTDHRLIDEFFILRKFRRQGCGERAAVWLFNQYPGTWEVGEIPENGEAQQFWRAIIDRYTGGNYQEVNVDNLRWHGPVQIFEA